MTSKKSNNASVSPQHRVWRQMSFSSLVSASRAALAMEHLATAAELGLVVFEMRAKPGAPPRWFVAAHPHHIARVEELLKADLPVQIHQPRHARGASTQAARLHLHGARPHLVPERAEDAARGIYSVVAGLRKGEEAVIQLLVSRRFGPPVPDRDTWIALFQTLLAPGPVSASQTVRPRHRQAQHGFASQLRLAATATTDGRARYLITQMRSALKAMEPPKTRMILKEIPESWVLHARRPWRWSERFTSGEAAGLLGWPVSDEKNATLPAFNNGHPKLLPPPARKLFPTSRVLGRSAAPGYEDQQAGLPIGDSLFHTHVLGPTGVGKSTMLLNLLAVDAAERRSIILCDPKGDLADDFLARIPPARFKDVVILDASSSRPVGLNPLAGPARLADQRADMLISVFESMETRPLGTQVRQTLTAAIYTLVRVPGATLLWLTPLLTDTGFRRRILKQVTDRTGLEFWDQFEAMTPEQQSTVAMPILRRLQPIQVRRSLRGILGQATPAFDLHEVFTKRRILIFKGNRGLIGAEPVRVIGNLLIGLLWQHTLARQSISPEKRHPVHLVIDEAHEFLGSLGDDLTDVLSMARSLGLAVTAAHQHRTQLSKPMQKAVDANTRNKIIYALNPGDAATTARGISELTVEDFTLLPEYHAHVNLMSNRRPTGWMTLKMNPATPATQDAAEVYATSQQAYGRPIDEVENAFTRATQPTTTSRQKAHSNDTSTDDKEQGAGANVPPRFGRSTP